MNRKEFMKKLEQLLQDLPIEERTDALQYYEDYFEDAGPDREAEVIRELGSPEQVAQSICEDLNLNQQWSQWESKEANNTQGFQSSSYGRQEEQNYGYGQDYYDSGSRGQQSSGYGASETDKWNVLAFVIIIVTLPITLPCIGSVFAAVLSVFLGVFGCIIGFLAGGVALLIGAVVLFTMGMTGVGFIILGIGVFLICFAFLLMPLAVWVCGTAVPAIYRFVKRGVLKILQKGGTVI